MKMRTLAATIAATVLVGGSALAFVAPEYLAERNLEVASGNAARLFRPVSDRAPGDRAARAATALAKDFGTVGTTWDDDTGVPLRIWGAGIAVPGANQDPQIAERAARELLAARIDLLAPGSTPLDWQLAWNEQRTDTRTVVFTQTWRGLPVIGGRIEMEFKNDRLFVIGSEALPDVQVAMPSRIGDASAARDTAAAWVGAAYGATMSAGPATGLSVLPVITHRGGIHFHVVQTVVVDSTEPLGRWNVFVDASSGAPIARHEALAFATGTLLYHVPTSYPQAGYHDRPALFATHTVNGGAATADASGAFTWSGTAAAAVTPGLAGTYVKISTQSGAAAAGSLNVQPGASATWDQSADEKLDAQLDAFINANDAKQYAFAHVDANLPWLKQQIPVFVNETQTCNAYSNGDDIHFFVAGPNPNYNPNNPASIKDCTNTGRINDVLYHEFGHSLNANSFMGDWNTVDGGFGEGQADTYAQTMIDNSGIGRGFDLAHLTTPLRESNPVGKEYTYPQDTGEVHDSGMILSGTMWDLRVALIAKYGHDAGRAKHDAMYYGIIQHAPDMPSAYTEALAANDDNGNLADGTPDQCLIQDAFAAHGLASGAAVTGLGTPSRDGFTVAVPVVAGNSSCPPPDVSSATLTWQLRDDPATTGTVPLSLAAQSYTGVIPTQPDGKVVQYKVAFALASGSTVSYPDNPADPMYEFFVGPVTPIKCWDFETAPTDWTHSAKSGTDEWQWGAPAGTQSNTDPTMAHGGSNVFGIDLAQSGGDGMYEMNSDQIALSPVVDTTGYTNVRLQYYRWLNVEDGFFDHATIQVDGQQRWANFDSNMGDKSTTAHRDREWRFQDVDVTADAADHKVQIGFELSSDPGLAFGGWTLDDVCLVGVAASAPASCGNGVVETGEQCDDGNTAAGDGCSATCQSETGTGGGPGDTGCCSSSRSNAAGPALLGLLVVFGLRRRKRR